MYRNFPAAHLQTRAEQSRADARRRDNAVYICSDDDRRACSRDEEDARRGGGASIPVYSLPVQLTYERELIHMYPINMHITSE